VLCFSNRVQPGGRKEVLVISYSFILLSACCRSNPEHYKCAWAGNKWDGVPPFFFFLIIFNMQFASSSKPEFTFF